MQLPAQFGKYELEQFLGGGMSHVFKARDTVLNRVVCVKILTPEGSTDPETRARFLAEAKMSASLVHDNIIRIFDYGEQDAKPYIVMEFLTGSDLRHAIREATLPDLQSRMRVAAQGARALAYVHQQKLIHRDIKPDNLHIDPSGRVRLMDFGIAKSQDLHLTKTGFQVGTPYYMAPEQIMGDPATERVDIYAYGILLYELLTGARPVAGETIERLFYQILHQPLDFEPLRAIGVPETLVNLIAVMTAKNAAERPASFEDILPTLDYYANPAPATPPPPATLPNLPVPPAAPPTAQTQSVAGSTARTQTQPTTAAAAQAQPSPEPEPAPQVGGRKVALAVIGVAIVIVAAFILAVLFNKDLIISSFSKRKALIPPPEMVLVEAGPFLAGRDKQTQTLPVFFIDHEEVSTADYAKFAAAQGLPAPAAQPNLPITGIGWDQARAYCEAAGKRLPTALEWEKAARGRDGREYPWGSAADPAKATTDGKPLQPVNSNPQSASPFGAINMAGNVWEWVDDKRTPSPAALEAYQSLLTPPPTATEPWYAVKGGAADRPLAEAVTYEFITLPARFTAPDIGFRCAKTPPNPQ